MVSGRNLGRFGPRRGASESAVVMTPSTQVDEQSLRTFENRVRQVLMSSGARAAPVSFHFRP